MKQLPCRQAVPAPVKRTDGGGILLRHLFLPALLFCLAALTAGCKENSNGAFQGYIEGEYLLVSSPLAGQLDQLLVKRGMQVAAGDALFSLDRSFEQAAVNEAEHVLRQAESRLADLMKGQRPSELAAIGAALEQAKASLDLSKKEYQRRSKLFDQKVIPQDQLDRTRTEMERNSAAVDKLTAELETAQLGARTDQIEAARAEVEAARSRLTQAEWSLEQKMQPAPEGGLVFDTFYVAGEFVPAAHPVVSLLPPDNITVRFFVPEASLASMTVGKTVHVRIDGKSTNLRAEITYVSPQAEYTPPVIYSRETRSKLVYMIEADFAPAEAAALHPGQPADIFPEAPDA